MESSLTDKLRTFKFGEEVRGNTYKFMPTIRAIPYEELTSVQEKMKSFGVEMTKPSQIKIAAYGSKEVARRLEYASEHGIIFNEYFCVCSWT